MSMTDEHVPNKIHELRCGRKCAKHNQWICCKYIMAANWMNCALRTTANKMNTTDEHVPTQFMNCDGDVHVPNTADETFANSNWKEEEENRKHNMSMWMWLQYLHSNRFADLDASANKKTTDFCNEPWQAYTHRRRETEREGDRETEKREKREKRGKREKHEKRENGEQRQICFFLAQLWLFRHRLGFVCICVCVLKHYIMLSST